MHKQFYNYLINLNEYDRKLKLSGSLALSLEEFQNRWKSFAKKFEYLYEEFETSIDDKIFNIKINGNKNIAFLGDIIEFGNEKILKNITMLASGDGTPQSGVSMLIAIGILIASLNPQENVDLRNEIFEELDILNLQLGIKNVTIKNDFIYTLNFNKGTGLCFSVKRK